MDNAEMVKQAIKERDAFLNEHPDLEKYQRDLDLSLSGIEDPSLRLCVLMKKISKNMEVIGALANELK